MAKLEIPSIIVEKGGGGCHQDDCQGDETGMATVTEQPRTSLRGQRTLSKQEEVDEEDECPIEDCIESPADANYQQPSAESCSRPRSGSKVKLLVRSHALCEETSPPPELCHHPPSPGDSATSTPRPTRHRLRRDSHDQSSSLDTTASLSRGNSREQYDGSNNAVDLHQFIVETLNRNQKDRMLLFKIENELISLAKDTKRNSHKFNQMSSYQRMLVHRVAAYFNMEHNVDPAGTSVVVNTTRLTRLPLQRFRDLVREDLLEEPRRSILKRDSSSFEETGSLKNGERMLNGDSRRSKSFEEREEEYEKARRRIFNHEHMADGDIECMEDYQQWEGRVQCQNCSRHQHERSVRLLKVESYESGDTLKANSLRLSVAKSNSFNGYDQQKSHEPQARILTKQDSGSSMSSRISPSSSGYKSQRSDATLSATPSPSATPSLHAQLSGQSCGAGSPEPSAGAVAVTTTAGAAEPVPVVWAVTDLASVPPGSVLIHPQTGQPYTNADGSIYHYDPAKPPSNCAAPEPPATPTLLHAKQECLERKVENRVYENGNSFTYSNGGYTQTVHGTYSSPHPVLIPQTPEYSYPQHPPPHHCEPRPAPPPPPQQSSSQDSELAGCMVGLSVGEDNRMVYWAQGQSPYYPAAARYPPPFHLPAPHGHIPPPLPAHSVEPAPPHPATVNGGCYVGGMYPGPEYITSGYAPAPPPPPQAPTVHVYYPPPPPQPCAPQAPGNSGGQALTTYYSPVVATSPYSAPAPCHAHPTPPHTPQGMCPSGGGAVYNSCYQGPHYPATPLPAPPPPPAAIPALPHLLRKPSLQVGVRCGSPLRCTKGDRGDEKAMLHPMAPQPPPSLAPAHPQPPPPPHQPPPPALYGIRLVPADMRLFSNPGGMRMPFPFPPGAAPAMPPPPPHHQKPHIVRKHYRMKVGGKHLGGGQPDLTKA